MKHRLLRTLALASTALLLGAAAPQARTMGGWNATITLTPDGSHVVGNPDAQIKLTEFISYTCPHCAHFEAEAGAPLRLGYVTNGKLSIEVRHYLRDPIDLAAAMLTNCGPKERFFQNHAAFMLGQSRWMAPVSGASDAQKARWTHGSLGERNRAIASDLGFYAIMEGRGYDRVTTDRCLSDEAMAKRLAAQAEEADKLGVTGTPSFAINGVLLFGTHEWDLLRLQLDARM